LQVAELKNFLFKPAAVGTTADHNLKKSLVKAAASGTTEADQVYWIGTCKRPQC